jgi:hypothetical protein
LSIVLGSPQKQARAKRAAIRRQPRAAENHKKSSGERKEKRIAPLPA